MVVSAGAVSDVVAELIADGTTDIAARVEAFGVLAVALSSRGGVRLVESTLAGDCRRAPRLRNSGGATMTIAVSSNARKKRLSIGSDPRHTASRVPDRSRQGGMGDTARCGGARASYHVARHDARALRWRTQSNSDNNGTPQVAGDRV